MPSLEVLADWRGPFGWPRLNTELPSVPPEPGVYLLCVEFSGGFLIYAAGVTSRPVPERLREHAREYQRGVYNVLDADALRSGIRREIWHGFWMQSRPPDRVAAFAARQSEIAAAAIAQMRVFRIFTAQVSGDKRVLNRVEAAIMNHLYAQAPPFSTIPDTGMYLAPRRPGEAPITLRNTCASTLHKLPEVMEI